MTSLYKEIIESIGSGESLIFIETIEEQETIELLKNISKTIKRSLISWDSVNNFMDISPPRVPEATQPMSDVNNLSLMLNEITNYGPNAIFVLKDVSYFMNDNTQCETLAVLVRAFKRLNLILRSTGKTIIILGPTFNIASELRDIFSLFYFKRPDFLQLQNVYLDLIANNNLTKYATCNEQVKDEILNAAKGLTADQFRNCIIKSVVRNGNIDSRTVDLILNVKQQIIKKDGLLEYIEEEVDVNTVGGLNLLKDWFLKRQKGFSKEARDLGLPEPKGILVFGVPGTGKSLISKAVSAIWRRPIIRFDIGRIFQSFVGQSENNMREALRIAESISPCILWIDELEKGFAGASSGHEVTARVLGNFLTWMQEKKDPVFVIATANDVSSLPSEFLRKGRFDELFFVDVPNELERKEIFNIHLNKYKLKPEKFNIDNLVSYSKNYTGAEIEQAIIEASYNAFFENREVILEDIRTVLTKVTPIYVSYQNKINTNEYNQIRKMAKDASPRDKGGKF